MKTNLEKWGPIIDALKITDEKKREIMADYAERHARKEAEFLNHVIENATSDSLQLIPVALKILSKVKLEGKNVEFDNGQPNLQFSVYLPETKREDLYVPTTVDRVRELENQLIEKISNYINTELETKDTLIINLLVQSISIIAESIGEDHFNAPKMQMMSRFSIK
jgi:hypothetical protein